MNKYIFSHKNSSVIITVDAYDQDEAEAILYDLHIDVENLNLLEEHDSKGEAVFNDID